MALSKDYPEFTEIVTWPDSQDLMDKVGFRKNSALINSPSGLDKYGGSAYIVNPEWLDKVRSGEITDQCDDDYLEKNELLVDYSVE